MKKTNDKAPMSYNWIVKNLLLAVLAVAALLLAVSLGLHFGTRHGQEIEVPDFTNLLYEEAVPIAKAAGLKVEVTDSGYMHKMRKNAIYNQNPKPGSMVKKGRKIELTTNSRQARKMGMPSLVGLSTQQARSELASKGLTLGKLIYQKDIATNIVIRQQYRGRDIKPGTPLHSGSSINLVVGLNPSDNRTYVPDVVGKPLLRAQDIIHDSYLNIGSVKFDSNVRSYADSLNAVVYSQEPVGNRKAVTMGTEVSIRLGLKDRN